MSGKKEPTFAAGAFFVCPDCGRETRRTGATQVRCHACADRIRHPRTGVGRGKGARLGGRHRNPPAPPPKTLAGLSIVEVDRIAKERHISYGQLVAGWENEKAAGVATPTTEKREEIPDECILT